jgi:hypothetical protein
LALSQACASGSVGGWEDDQESSGERSESAGD